MKKWKKKKTVVWEDEEDEEDGVDGGDVEEEVEDIKYVGRIQSNRLKLKYKNAAKFCIQWLNKSII